MQLHDTYKKHVAIWHARTHFSYQDKIAKAVLGGIEDARNGQVVEIPIELPRQSGKTTTIVDITEFLLIAHMRYFNEPLSIGIFAPQKEQATTDFDRLKIQFPEISPLGFSTKAHVNMDAALKMPEKWNSKTIRVYHGGKFFGEVYIFPLAKTSNPESKTFGLLLFEEAQLIDDQKMQRSAFPMGASTNAPRVYIGTAGTRLCYFKKQLDTNPRAIKVTLDEVFRARRAVAENTGDQTHLRYEQFVQHEINEEGADSDYIKTQYLNTWVIGTGQFCTEEQIAEIIDEERAPSSLCERPCYVGIDTAKSPDQTVVTVIGDSKKDPLKSDLIAWLSMRGENYEDQFEIISDWLAPKYEDVLENGKPKKNAAGEIERRLVSGFPDIRVVALDATGQGDFMPDKFERHSPYNVMRVKFTLESKDVLYKNLLQVMHNKLTSIPAAVQGKDFIEWKTQMLNLEKEYKGRFLSVHHPDDPKAHDDYPDSWAIAEYAKSEAVRSEPSIRVL